MGSNSGLCFKCNEACFFKETKNETFGYPCDCCKRIICKNCSGISSTEIRVIMLSARIMPFYCPSCIELVKKLPLFEKRICDLELDIQNRDTDTTSKIVTLEQRVVRLEVSSGDESSGSMLNEMSDLKLSLQAVESKLDRFIEANVKVSSQVQQTSAMDDGMVVEMNDRQRKLNNVMLYNLVNQNNIEDSEHDFKEAAEIVKEVTKQDLKITKVLRVGKKNKNGAQALRVIFSNAEDALRVIRSKRFIDKSRKVFIGADLTTRQIEQVKGLKKEVEERRKKGEENVRLMYVKGVPQVSKN